MTTSTEVPIPMPEPLDEVVLAPGDPAAYSGEDHTATPTAVRAGEVPILRPGQPATTPETAVLELRIHGVGGAPPEMNLEHPTTVQVSGDATAGFYRSWIPGGTGTGAPRREAYCWGKLNYRSASRALWLLLIAFMLVNVAQWALPAPRRPGDTRDNPRLLLTNTIARSILRVLALVLTVAMFATIVSVLGDLLAWQAAHRGLLPSWLRWYGGWSRGEQLASALLAALALLGLLFWNSYQSAAQYERWRSSTVPAEDGRWPLTRAAFWNGARSLARQRGCHAGAAAGYVAIMGALAGGGPRWLVATIVGVGCAFLLGSVALTASPWTDRRRVATNDHEGPPDILCTIVGIGATALAVLVSAARFWWSPASTNPTLPFDLPLQVAILWTQLAMVALLAVVVAVQRPWKQPGVLGKGMATPLLALLACLVSGIFGGAVTLTIANLLGSPKAALGVLPDISALQKPTLYVPTSVYAYGFGFLITAGMVVVFLIAGLLARARGGREASAGVGGHDDVSRVYADAVNGGPLADPARTTKARRAVGTLWAQARLTDFIALGLAGTAGLTAAGVGLYQALEMIDAGHHLPRELLVASSVGSLFALALTGYFLVQLRAALRDSRIRRRIGLIWDVGTFWPRSCHPFAPPCYAERSIPEVVTRIRHVVGDVRTSSDPVRAQAPPNGTDSAAGLREQHSPLLLAGYSQGSPIAVAVAAQLPPNAVGRVALLTLAAPVRRLYGRTFPAYFGPACLEVLTERLTDATTDQPRWRNLVRRSDYIGGWAIQAIPPGAGQAGPVDREILDPPTLWADNNPTPPPHHLHSDWFPDPQTRPFAVELMQTLVVGSSAVRTSGADPWSVGQPATLTAETSNSRVILSETSTPPASSAALKLTP